MNTSLHTKLPEGPNIFKNLYKWTAPERYWERKDRAWYIVYSLFFVLIILALAILGEYIMILAALSFMLLWFAQAYIPPKLTEHSITTIGIRAYDKLYKWSEINHFWFSKKNNTHFLHIEQPIENSTHTRRASLILDEENQDEEIFEILMRFVDYGRKDEVGYNILAKIINGEYVEIEKYMK